MQRGRLLYDPESSLFHHQTLSMNRRVTNRACRVYQPIRSNADNQNGQRRTPHLMMMPSRRWSPVHEPQLRSAYAAPSTTSSRAGSRA
ncbi:hypothetical protein Pst134EA_033147 [Puccinia striiformis f. sp. tritici]|uniref:hypothetical protein n=1 Tax=Puccinia striiformis f. sp. tritici TaxID=168172 RepID=UPI0020074E8F|nr:hypothetical protein Pst134EA_033147 [Puccinia striiformis f. sp. tritici]KAH9450244.1 hypothetical protein Pst134EA_033147 [Puccinia striiformis f. sp. tritici]